MVPLSDCHCERTTYKACVPLLSLAVHSPLGQSSAVILQAGSARTGKKSQLCSSAPTRSLVTVLSHLSGLLSRAAWSSSESIHALCPQNQKLGQCSLVPCIQISLQCAARRVSEMTFQRGSAAHYPHLAVILMDLSHVLPPVPREALLLLLVRLP